MATWTAPTMLGFGVPLPSTDYNAIANNTTFLYEHPYASYYASSDSSVPTGTPTQVTLGGTGFTAYGFSSSSNNLVVPLAGLYSIHWAVYYAGNAGTSADFCGSLVYQNGAQILNGSTPSSSVLDPISGGSGIAICNANDTLGLYAYQNSGTTFNTQSGNGRTYLQAFFVGST